MNVIGYLLSLSIFYREWMPVPWTSLIDVVLQDRGPEHTACDEEETEDDSVDWWERNAHLSEKWVDQAVHDGYEDNDGERIKVLHEVIWDAMRIHLFGLGHEVVRELVVAYPIDGVYAKDPARNQSPLQFLDEMVVPSNGSA